jgi:hypothetical protein
MHLLMFLKISQCLGSLSTADLVLSTLSIHHSLNFFFKLMACCRSVWWYNSQLQECMGIQLPAIWPVQLSYDSRAIDVWSGCDVAAVLLISFVNPQTKIIKTPKKPKLELIIIQLIKYLPFYNYYKIIIWFPLNKMSAYSFL